MKSLLPIAVCMLMVSVGMSLSPRQLLENWLRLTPSLWAQERVRERFLTKVW